MGPVDYRSIVLVGPASLCLVEVGIVETAVAVELAAVVHLNLYRLDCLLACWRLMHSIDVLVQDFCNKHYHGL